MFIWKLDLPFALIVDLKKIVPHCTLYTVHCTLYTVHCTLYTVHCTLYTVHSTRYILHGTFYTVFVLITLTGHAEFELIVMKCKKPYFYVVKVRFTFTAGCTVMHDYHVRAYV